MYFQTILVIHPWQNITKRHKILELELPPNSILIVGGYVIKSQQTGLFKPETNKKWRFDKNHYIIERYIEVTKRRAKQQ